MTQLRHPQRHPQREAGFAAPDISTKADQIAPPYSATQASIHTRESSRERIVDGGSVGDCIHAVDNEIKGRNVGRVCHVQMSPDRGGWNNLYYEERRKTGKSNSHNTLPLSYPFSRTISRSSSKRAPRSRCGAVTSVTFINASAA